MDDVDDVDEPVDPDGAGAAIVFGEECSGDDEDEGGQEDEDDEDSGNNGSDEHPKKHMRMSADAEIALVGLEDGFFDIGRVSRSATPSHCSSTRSSSVESSGSKMSTS